MQALSQLSYGPNVTAFRGGDTAYLGLPPRQVETALKIAAR